MPVDPLAITVLREKDGQTKRQLADRAGISPQYLGDIEAGRRGAKPDVMKRLAAALNVPMSMLERKRSA